MSVADVRVSVASGTVTAEQFLELAPELGSRELIDGRIVTMAPAGEAHSFMGSELAVAIGHFVRTHRLGRTTLAEAGFLIRRDPDTVRAPDLAFVAREHLPATYSGGWSQLVPDLVLEVERTDFRQEDVLRKVGQWLDFGVTVVWVLYLSSQCLTEFRRDRQVRRYEESDILTCEDLLPGFAFPLAEVFAPPDEPA